jgi:germ cell nuclear acidic protein
LQKIPKAPYTESLDAFWSQTAINEWNDQHSPTKALKSPRKIQPRDVGQAEDSDGYASPCVSPRKSPSKVDKAVKEAKKTFHTQKQKLAQTFLERLDTEITQGQLAEIARDTGGIRIVWNKKLNSTAGRAQWRREGTVRKHSGGSVDKTYKHYASIELAEKVIDDEHRLYNTLAHEFCHLANFMISGVKDNPHGKEFRAW